MEEQQKPEEKFIQGTPPAVLLPAKNYVFKISSKHFVIDLPRKGSYHDIAPEFFAEDAGEFHIFDEESKVLYMPAITKVLFAAAKYPDLKFNQFFAPYSIKIEEDIVSITGQVIDMMLPVKQDGTPEGTEEGVKPE